MFSRAVDPLVRDVGVPVYERTCKQLRCVPARSNDAGTQTLAVGQANAEKINDFLQTWTNFEPDEKDRTPGRLVIDDDYVIADHDDDNFQINFPGIHGGEIKCLGGAMYDPFFVPTHQHKMLCCRLISVGGYDETMLNYGGKGAKFELNMLGKLVNTAGAAEAAWDANEFADCLVRFWNSDSVVNSTPSGAEVNISLYGAHFNKGMWFPNLAPEENASYADTIYCRDLMFSFGKTFYKIEEEQSTGHVIDRIKTDGWPCEYMFDVKDGGDVLVHWAYIPHGTFLRIQGTVSSTVSSFVVHDFKMDQNFVGTESGPYETWALGDYPIVDCQEPSASCKVRIGGNVGLFWFPPTWQMIKCKQALNATQPDIVCDIKGWRDEEAAAYSRLREKGYGWDCTTKYPFTPDSSCRLWIEAPAGLADGDTITSITDASTASNDLSGGVSPTFRRDGIHWQPTVDLYPDAVNKYLENTSPTDLDDTIGDFTVFAVFTTTNTANIQTFLSCQNNATPGSGGFLFNVWSDGKVGVGLGASAGVFSDNVVEDNRRTLVVISREASSGTVKIRLYGQVTEGTSATGTLTAVTGSLFLGARHNGGANVTQRWRGGIAHLSFFDTYVDLGDPADPPEDWDPSLWSETWAYQLWQHLTARFAVW